jgi:Na+-transporting NADH:ubiquinone oxidoreductase subunit C
MQRDSTNYVLFFTMAMTVIVAVVLAGMYSSLKDIHTTNEQNYNKKQILSSLVEGADKMSDDEVASIFEKQVEGVVITADGSVVEKDIQAADVKMEKEEKKAEEDRQYPVFKYKSDDGKDYFILSIRGNGLWDKIWGWVAIQNDERRTVVGAAFGHKGETPGLGAEIKDNTSWKNQFKREGGDKLKLYSDAGVYTGLMVKKGGAKDKSYQVDGISGATVTCDGVTEMLERGLAIYMPYLNSIKK